MPRPRSAACSAWSCFSPSSPRSASASSGCTGGRRPEFARASSPRRLETKREPLARGRAAGRLWSWRAARLRHRQRRRLPAVRVAAAAQGDRARLSPGLSARAAGPRARPVPARARRRALPDHPDGDAERPVLVRLVDRPGRLVLLRAGHARPLGGAWREPACGLPGRAGVRRRAGRAHPVRGVAASGPRER